MCDSVSTIQVDGHRIFVLLDVGASTAVNVMCAVSLFLSKRTTNIFNLLAYKNCQQTKICCMCIIIMHYETSAC